ncbi:hypothetical protein [Enterococcus nangangensis]|nr:hypothetical protein [Enterococcus nangangensis]
MEREVELAKELVAYTEVVGSHNPHIQEVAKELLALLQAEK